MSSDSTGASVERSQNVNAIKAARTIEPSDYAGMIKRCLRAMGKRAGDADPESLRLFAELREALDDAEHRAVEALLNEGYSFRDMGKALGVGHTAVFNKYNRRRVA